MQADGPPLLIGGNAPAAFRRMTEFGAGWIQGGGGPQAFADGADQARRAWRETGRAGEPRLAAIAYASLGDDAEAHARRYLGDYYSFTGEFAEPIAASALTSGKKVADTVAAFTDAGCDELILFPCNPYRTGLAHGRGSRAALKIAAASGGCHRRGGHSCGHPCRRGARRDRRAARRSGVPGPPRAATRGYWPG